MLAPLKSPAIFVTGTDTGVGKTLVAGAIASNLNRRGARVAVLKPVATGCVHRREGWVSEDAEFLAQCANTPHPLDLVCPERYAEPLAPAVAAERAKRPVSWEAVARSIEIMGRDADVMIVEGAGGVMVPLDATHLFADVAAWLGAPAVIVARAGLGTINHTLLSIEALRHRGVEVAGVVVNRYEPDQTPPDQETNPRAIERWGKTRILAIVPEAPVQMSRKTQAVEWPIPEDVQGAIDLVDWMEVARGRQ